MQLKAIQQFLFTCLCISGQRRTGPYIYGPATNILAPKQSAFIKLYIFHFFSQIYVVSKSGLYRVMLIFEFMIFHIGTICF